MYYIIIIIEKHFYFISVNIFNYFRSKATLISLCRIWKISHNKCIVKGFPECIDIQT